MAKINYMARDFDSLKAELLNKLNVLIPDLSNRTESEFAIVMVEVFAYVGDILSYSLDRYANEAYLPTAIQRESVIKLCNSIGYKLRNPKASIVTLKFTVDEINENDILIPIGTLCSTRGLNRIKFSTSEDAVIVSGSLSVEVQAKQGEIKEEIIGYGDGTKNQVLLLSSTPLLGEIKIYVDDQLWEETDSFFSSTDESLNYLVDSSDLNNVRICFGTGTNGVIPPDGQVIRTAYRVGGGKIGNVGINSIIDIDSDIYDSEGSSVGVTVNNEIQASGGQDIEPLDEARLNAPKQFVSKRAVTKEDYENLCSLFTNETYGDIIKAVCKRNDSTITEVDTWAWSRDNDNNIILASTELLDLLKTYLDGLVLIGMTNVINQGLINTVNISGTVHMEPNQSQAVIKPLVENAIKEFFDYRKYKAGQLIIKALVENAISSVDGVLYYEGTTPSSNITLAFNEMPKLGSITINYVFD